MRKDNVIDTRLLSSDAQLYESLFEKQYKKYKKHRNKFQRKIYGIDSLNWNANCGYYLYHNCGKIHALTRKNTYMK